MEAQKQVGEELETSVGWSPVLDEDYLHTDFLDWTNDVPVMVGSVFGEMNCWTALDPNETKNSWTDEEVDAKLTEKYGDKAEAVKEAFLKAYPEESACDAYYVSNRTGDFAHWQRDWNPEITKTTTILYPMSLHLTVV